MARSLGGHTRLISTLKIALPLLAIVLLGTVFLVTSPDDFRGPVLNFSEADRRALGQGMNILDANISGATAAGDTYAFRARKMYSASASSTEVNAETLSGTIQQVGGRLIDMAGPRAIFDLEAQTFTLTGGAKLGTSDGYVAETPGLRGDLRAGLIESQGAITAQGPAGQISAGAMRLMFSQENPAENAVIWFGNGVKLTFVPEPE
jgi:lipopolysaccharide export system protein LptC